MRYRNFMVLVVLVCSGVLAGCDRSKIVENTPQTLNDPSVAGFQSTLDASGGVLFSSAKSNNAEGRDSGGGAGIGVNAYLWRGALDTLAFMPLAAADPFGGVIITDWYAPPASNGERFKATAYILGRQLRADGVRVSLFRQVQQGGQWVDAPVNAATVSQVEDKVLARARELRAQSVAN